VESAPRVTEEVREIPQAFRVLQAHEPTPVSDRPEVALVAEEPGGAGPALRDAADRITFVALLAL